MAKGRFDAACAEEQLRAAGVDVTAVNACMGASDADRVHDVVEVRLVPPWQRPLFNWPATATAATAAAPTPPSQKRPLPLPPVSCPPAGPAGGAG